MEMESRNLQVIHINQAKLWITGIFPSLSYSLKSIFLKPFL